MLGEVLQRGASFRQAAGCIETRSRATDVVEPKQAAGLQSVEQVLGYVPWAIEMLEDGLDKDQVEPAAIGPQWVGEASASLPSVWRA
jgi:hypothetical protein